MSTHPDQTDMFPEVAETAIPCKILVVDGRHEPEVVTLIDFIESAPEMGANQ